MPPSMCDFSYRDGDILINDLHLVTTSSRIFTAIFPKISMLNHSCDPNIRNSFDGPFLRIHAAHDIAADEEIFNCYGPNYKLMSKMDRKSALKQQYCFDCNCQRCTSNDQTYEKYYEYVCPNVACRTPINFNFPDHQWWHHLDNDAAMAAIAPAFVCGQCQQPLLLNPKSLREFYAATATVNDSDFQYYRRRAMTEKAVAYYMAVSKCLSKHHELKAIMSQALLKYQMHGTEPFVLHLLSVYINLNTHSKILAFFLVGLFVFSADKEELFSKLAYIAMENYVITRERFGQLSLETVISITYALNILNLAKEFESETKRRHDDIVKIRKIFDVKKMEKSLAILSSAMQTIFKQAFNELNTTDKQEKDRVNEQLSKLNLSEESSGDSSCSEDSDTVD